MGVLFLIFFYYLLATLTREIQSFSDQEKDSVDDKIFIYYVKN